MRLPSWRCRDHSDLQKATVTSSNDVTYQYYDVLDHLMTLSINLIDVLVNQKDVLINEEPS